MFYKQVHIFREKEIELARMLLQKGLDPLLFREIAACQQMVQKNNPTLSFKIGPLQNLH